MVVDAFYINLSTILFTIWKSSPAFHLWLHNLQESSLVMMVFRSYVYHVDFAISNVIKHYLTLFTFDTAGDDAVSKVEEEFLAPERTPLMSPGGSVLHRVT